MSRHARHIAAFSILAAASCAVHALDWSDNALSYRYGTRFAEPFNDQDISKNIVNFTHADGYTYGSNFLSIDYLMSSAADPSSAGSDHGAHETYVVYRHTLDFGKISGKDWSFPGVRGVGATLGFDYNSKTDAGYNSRKHMPLAGPTLMLDVPGFLNISLLALWESNAPFNTYTGVATPRYTYRTHAMLTGAWAIPFNAGVPLSFEGYANYISAKGKDEFGGSTAPETNIDMEVMYDMSAAVGAKKNTFKVGVEYQYWHNKFGNPSTNNPGATARTPMVRAEYHF